MVNYLICKFSKFIMIYSFYYYYIITIITTISAVTTTIIINSNFYLSCYAHILRVASHEAVQSASPDADIPMQEIRFS